MIVACLTTEALRLARPELDRVNCPIARDVDPGPFLPLPVVFVSREDFFMSGPQNVW